MDAATWQAITSGLTCDITTTGRASGQPRRIEIWYFCLGDQVYLTGTPGPRHWLANLHADPQMTFHVKEGTRADLPAVGVPISDPAERRRIMGAIMQSNAWFASQHYDLDAWVAGSPLVRVEFAGREAR
jgi:deazaflavin-dependent oxidoreductase (nitroreductase family)